ncbi:ABC transporter ATP-binding protein [Staphylococcus agnetis]|uniref:ABC transporter ATP-binding protein n=1 Tax=Staphylococcus agnetis TaxID=985762 RepID=UPI0004E3D5E1|nr:ABC transporter ATP-binding protein [Staphylococcus agnetis]KFE41062.1 ABC-type multidrug transport system, ATPase component [Staphylococcus agnetis]NJH65181.1 ATP-binding cassette domain-containing protein [Staphylococcus agnetis]NJH98635.1 ATP-binding cassette domain-containing protein [Staphylococcus agnetis]PTH46979.1 ABC transporter ATP-binding protein [Staphylococcus agnetis]PTH71422.1 ABC transporter ATP-binding protein [Staphylococcus agnetis]
MITKVENLHKYLNNRHIIKGISFSLKEGSINAIIGPNGVGKTTTIRLLTGLLKPSNGGVTVFNTKTIDKNFDRIRQKIGVQNDGNLYESLTVYENLKVWSGFCNLEKLQADSRIEYLLNHFNILDRKNAKVGTLSKGLKQKVSIIRALLHEPKLLILDEPTSGLDPSSSDELIIYLKKIVKDEKLTVFMCTHQLQGIEDIVDNIFIMFDGRFIASGSVQELIKEEWPKVKFEITTDDVEKSINILKEVNDIPFEIGETQTSTFELLVDNNRLIAKIIYILVKENIELFSVKEIKHSIKELYFKKIGEAKND